MSGLRPSFGRLLCMALCLSPSVCGAAHPISVTKTYAYVSQEKVSAKIEVFVEDLYLFHKLQPNEQDFLEPDVVRRGIEQHKQFLLERFVIRDLSGERLAGRVVEIKECKMDERGVALAALMAHTIAFEIQYETPTPPEFFTFSQHFTDEQSTLPSEMTLIVKQEGAGAAINEVLKPDEPHTMRFSWDNPPLSAEASREEQQKWLAKRKEETLGITSYSSVYSFLYIEDHEVRHEILIPLLTLEESVLIARDDDDFLDIAEQDAARQQIDAYFASGNPIEIDGDRPRPIVQQCDFYGLDIKDFAKRTERRRVSMANARVGIILSYPTPRTPETVKVTWNRFNDYVWAVSMVVYAFEEASRVTLSRLGGNNVYAWRSPGRPPTPALKQARLLLPPSVRQSIPLMTVICLIAALLVALAMRGFGVAARKCLIAAAILVICAVIAWPHFRWEAANPFSKAMVVSDDRANDIFALLHENTYRAFDFRTEDEVYDALATSIDGELLNDLYLQINRRLKMEEQGGAVSRIRDVEILEGTIQPITVPEAEDKRGFQYRCRWNVSGTVEHWGHVHARTNQYQADFMVQPRAEFWKITNIEFLDEQRISFETKPRGL
ncbi:MAG: hypothetical protein VB876_16050 [Pirellulales bacterium]